MQVFIKKYWIWNWYISHFQGRTEQFQEKTVKSFETSDLWIKGVSKSIKNWAKGQNGRFLDNCFGALGSILLANLLSGEGTIKVDKNYWYCLAL